MKTIFALLFFSVVSVKQPVSYDWSFPFGERTKMEARKLINKIYNELKQDKSSFCSLATLYSEDPGSLTKCGELGWAKRGMFVAEFEAVAFSLNPGEISKPFLTEFGFHIVELIDRRGEETLTRHILVGFK